MSESLGEELIERIRNAAGLILGVSENRSWVEFFFEGDLMHTKTVNLPVGCVFDIYVEEVPHKTTVYEHPRTMIFFTGPCDVEIVRDCQRCGSATRRCLSNCKASLFTSRQTPINPRKEFADNRAVRIDSLKPAPLAALETQEILPVGRQRVPPNTTSLNWGSSALPALELGQEIDAVVLQLLPGDRLLLELGGQQVEAESPSGLSVGQRLLLRVDELQPQLVLHITELEPTIEAEAARLLRTLLPAHADAGALLEHLDSLLQSDKSPPIGGALTKLKEAITTLLSDGAPPTPERLKNLFQGGGIYYEAKLLHAAKEDAQSLRAVAGGDLKGLLLSALKETDAGAFPAEFKNAISAQLNNLETQQAVNLLAQLDGGMFQFQIPFFTGAGFSTAALSVERDGKGGTESRDSATGGYNLLFLLDLENFGRTRIDAHVTEKQLRVIFYVDREGSIALLRQELPSFRETLLAMGYREVLLAVTPLKDIPTEKRQKFDAIAVGAPTSIHLLDVKI